MADQPPIMMPPVSPVPIVRRQESDQTIKWKIDPEDVITEIIHYLRGDIFDDKKGEWKSPEGIYRFVIQGPNWFHDLLLRAQAEKKIEFFGATYNSRSHFGDYLVKDKNSYENTISLINGSLDNIQRTRVELEKKKAKAKDPEKIEIPHEDIIYSVQYEEPQRLVNEVGLRVITSNLRGYLNKNIILSNFESEEMIRQMALDNALNMVNLIYTSHEKFGIKKEHFTSVLNVVDVNVFAALLRAHKGFFVNHLSTTERYIEQNVSSFQEQAADKKKGFSLFGWLKGGN